MAIVTPTSGSVRASRSSSKMTWQEAVRTAIRDPVELCRILSLPEEVQRAATRGGRSFPLFVPRQFAGRMKPGYREDPLLLQVLPTSQEVGNPPSGAIDPVGDNAATVQPGLIKKYHGRVLFMTTGACAVHCRYCFRRHFPYERAPHSLDQWQPALDQIAADATIEEVLLSGGDPLMLVDNQLARLAASLAAIPHVQRLRIHTRLPIMIPQRVTASLIDWLTGRRLVPLLVVHTNHPHEIDDSVRDSLERLVAAGIPLLNQTVLLRGVNDCADALVELSRRLISARVMPYYLHQLDRVRGATHFEVPVSRGKEIIRQMRERLPGYAVPRYVQETAGEPAKTVLA